MAAAGVAALGTSESQTAQGQEPKKLLQSPLGGAGIETQTGQAIYSLPRDHAWHGGAFYQSNEYNEWHYITALGRDLKTG